MLVIDMKRLIADHIAITEDYVIEDCDHLTNEKIENRKYFKVS